MLYSVHHTYRVRQENLNTSKIAVILAVSTLQKRVAMERGFCGLFGDIFKNCEKCSYEALFSFFWQVAESAFADLKSNIKI